MGLYLKPYLRSWLQALAGALVAWGVTSEEASQWVDATVPIVLAVVVHLVGVIWSFAERRKLLERIRLGVRF
jgi:hypothetical protein